MKYNFLVSSAVLALASAAAAQAPQRRSYDGYKVVRLTVGQDVAKVNGIIDRLGLTTWKGKPRAGAAADIVIPPSQADAFVAETTGMEAVTMHEDLGASIAQESTFHIYAGTFSGVARGWR